MPNTTLDFYNDNSLYYPISSKLTVFPCAWRDHGIDPEARLNSEKSLSNLGGQGGGNKSYISIANSELSNTTITIVLNGYTFTLSGVNLSEFITNTSTTVYVKIKLESYSITNSKTSTKLGSFYSNSTGESENTTNAVLDIDLDGSGTKYFTGLAFSLTKPEDISSYIKIYENGKFVNRNILPINITNGKETGSIVLNSVSNFNDEATANETNIASNIYAFASGFGTTASGEYSHTEGFNTTASNNATHAEGNLAKAFGNYSHAEGNETTAYGQSSHAEGYQTKTGDENDDTKGKYAHAEGFNTTASNEAAHAEGKNTNASGHTSHAEGLNTTASGNYGTHAEGEETDALGDSSHSEGYYTVAIGDYSHAEGQETTASSNASHTEGKQTRASGTATHAEGSNTIASGEYAHVEGHGNIISDAVVFGTRSGTSTQPYIFSYVSAAQSVKKGSILRVTISDADYYLKVDSIADNPLLISFTTLTSGFPTSTVTLPNASLIRGIASGEAAHAESSMTTASGTATHAEGSNTIAGGAYSHAEGNGTVASGNASHAEGNVTTASGSASHAEGYHTEAFGNYSHAEGYYTIASSNYSHVEGYYTKANKNYQHVFGKYNVEDNGKVEIVGWGTADNQRKNIRTLDETGNEILTGYITCDGFSTNGGYTPAATTERAGIYINGNNEINFTSSGNDICFGYKKYGKNAVTNYRFYNSSNSSTGGTIYAGSFYATSDARLKENIITFKPEKSILDLPVYKFDFITGTKNNIGCLAQDLQEICPEIVHEGTDGYLSIEESKIIYLLLDEVKKLKVEVEELKHDKK